VFAEQGTYRVNVEVNGIDFDNTFLPEPIKYQYSLTVAVAKKFPVSYEDRNFNVNISSPLSIQNVELKPESKQLIIQYPSGEWQHFDNFQVYVDIPKEMMSGPFTAVFNRMELEVSEVQKDDNGTTTLFLNDTHLDLIEMNQTLEGGMEGMEEMNMEERPIEGGSQQNAIVITAATVVPDCPPGLPLVTAVGFSVIVFFILSLKKRFNL
jgi:hypothetical protein